MGKMKELAIDSGEEVVQAIGELGATVNDATKAAAETEVDGSQQFSRYSWLHLSLR